jgi:hypothetical protein
MSRWKAASIHLGISVLIIGAIVGALILVWYPDGLFLAAGGSNIALILAAVDGVIGPLLTLIVFKAGKKSLRFDLTVIALLQLGALVYGMYTLWASRPVFLVAVVDRVEVVFANEIDDADLAEASREEWRKLSLTGPIWVGAEVPQGKDAFDAAVQGFGGRDIHQRPRFYVERDAIWADIAAKAESVAKLIERKPEAASVLSSNEHASELKYLPLTSQRAVGAALLRASDNAFLRFDATDPWAGDVPAVGEE